MSLIQEFKTFIQRGNVVDLAVAVVVGGAFGKIVTALVEGFVMPLVSYVLPKGEWQTFMVGRFKVGALMAASLDFLAIAFVVFLVLVKGVGRFRRPAPEPEAPATRECPMCLESVPVAARRCKHCTSDLV